MADRGGRGRGRGGGGDRGRGRGRGDFSGGRGGGGATFSGVGYGGDNRGGRGGRGGGDFRGGGGGGRGRGDFRGGRGGGRGRGDKFAGEDRVFRENAVPQPDPAVSQLEDKILNDMDMTSRMASLQVSKTSTPQTDDLMPIRPAYGTKGTEVVLWTNYFALDVKTPSLYSYLVKTAKQVPETKESTESPKEKPAGKGKGKGKGQGKDGKKETVEAKGMKLRSIIKSALDEVAKGIPYATEFKAQVVSLSPLKLPQNKTVSVKYTEEGREETYDAKFDSQPDVDMDALRSYIGSMQAPPSENAKFPRFNDAIDALGIITGSWARNNDRVGSLGRSRYFPLNMDSEKNSLGYPDLNTVIRGYFQSARPATGRLLLNANVSHGVFRPSGLVTKMMDDFGVNNNPPRSLDKFLSGLRARIRISPEKGVSGSKEKYFKKLITGIASPNDNRGIVNGPKVKREAAGPSEVSFYLNGDAPPGLKAGQYYTVSQYYLAKYEYKPNDNYPVVKCGRQRPTYFPAELCQVIEGQVLKRKTNSDETATMITYACRSPWANAVSLSTVGRKVLGLDGNPKLTEFKVAAGKELLTVRGRELVPPSVTYLNNNRQRTNVSTSDGGWNMRSVRVVKPGRPISKFTYLTVHWGNAGDVSNPMQAFIAHMKTTGLNILATVPYKLPATAYIPRGANPKDILRPMFAKLSQDPPDMLFVVLPGKKTDEAIYKAIKCLGDVEFGIATQCVLQSNFIKGNLQYFANVALKVNLKMGGVNHKLSNDVPLIKEGKTMVVGYDVTHPTNLGKKADGLPSLVGLVASVDQDLGQWPAAAWAQDSKQEMLDQQLLKEKFGERLNLWRKNNRNNLPENILIFRDGVSEGQFSQVLGLELPSIRAACNSLYPANRSPKITIVVSVKRHQTRFYPTDPDHMTGSRNIKNGTVVDRGVTQATVWDFFLTAHSALQGTARPAHYTVLLDEIFRSKQGTAAADGLQTLTHELCYLFGRATKAVSICPPAYYADIICTRQRVFMHEAFERSDTESVSTTVSAIAGFKEVHPRLRDTMYYM